MNTLSLLLYLANLATNLKVILVIGIIVAAIFYGVRALNAADDSEWDAVKSFVARGILLSFFIGIITVFVPSKQTLHLIIASELGETVVKSEDGQEIYRALKKKILRELEVDKSVNELLTTD